MPKEQQVVVIYVMSEEAFELFESEVVPVGLELLQEPYVRKSGPAVQELIDKLPLLDGDHSVKPPKDDHLVDDLDLPLYVRNILRKAGIPNVGELRRRTEVELLDLPGFGKAALGYVRGALREMNLSLRASPEYIREMDDILIEELDLNVKPYNCLKRAGQQTIGGLLRRTKQELSGISGMTQKALDEVIEKLDRRGLLLRED